MGQEAGAARIMMLSRLRPRTTRLLQRALGLGLLCLVGVPPLAGAVSAHRLIGDDGRRLNLLRRGSAAGEAAGEVRGKGSQGIPPGMTDMTEPLVNDAARDADIRADKISKTHMGGIHVCNDNWEDCEGQERNATKKAKKAGPIEPTEAVDPATRACPEFGPTVNGCECVDSCVCRTQTYCTTRYVKSDNSYGRNTTSPCGNEVDWRGDPIDDCTYVTVPPVRPKFNYEPKPEPWWAKEETDYYRAFGDEGNQRNLPKKGCYSRKLYCVQFPRFSGCNPDISYNKYRLTDEQREELEGCNAITTEKECMEHKVCGKGDHGTCHDDCLWGDDSPQWFRDMRRKQNVQIRAEGDPAVNKDSKLLPVLQPGYAGGKGAGGRLRDSNMGQKPRWARSRVPDSGTSDRYTSRRRKEVWPPPFFYPR